MIGATNTGAASRRLGSALLALLCVSSAVARARQATPPRHNAPVHSAVPAPRSQPARPAAGPQYQGRPPANQIPRPANQPPAPSSRPAYIGPRYPAANYPRPAVSGYPPPVYAPQGHLGDWLNKHRGLPVQDQERLLRSDPSFGRLNPGDQQRLVQQLRQVDQLTEEQRERRLARAEALERLSPQARLSVNLSARQWAALPPDRKAIMRSAFRDLRGVPLDQRQTVLNSSRYQGVFSPEERAILGDMLRVEPFEPAR